MPTRNPARPRLEPLEGRSLMATFDVTTGLDAGPGSLRQAILDANASSGADTIDVLFANLGTLPASLIRPTSPLPAITDPVDIEATNTRVDGTDAGAAADGLTLAPGSGGSTIRGLTITGFGGSGIVIRDTDGSTIVGCIIGVYETVSFDGEIAAGNKGDGISIVGGSSNKLTGNVIGSNGGDGIRVAPESVGGVASGNVLRSNRIGYNTMSWVGNYGVQELADAGYGIAIEGANGNIVGDNFPTDVYPAGMQPPVAGNDVGYNGLGSIEVRAGVGNVLQSNNLADRTVPSISLLDGGNRNQVAPVLSSLGQSGNKLRLGGSLDGAPSSQYVIQLYERSTDRNTNFGGPETVSLSPLPTILQVQTDSAGHATFGLGDAYPYTSYVATATDSAGDTSNFSTPFDVILVRADLSISTAAQPAIVAVGDQETIAILVRNTGPSTATDLSLQGLIPAGMTLASVRVSQGRFVVLPTPQGPNLVYLFGDLPAGSTASATLVVVPSVTAVTPIRFYAQEVQLNILEAEANLSVTSVPADLIHGPKVVATDLVVARGHVTGATLSFDMPLDPARASDPTNYRIGPVTGRGVVQPVSATYDAATHVVTLSLSRPFPVGVPLTVRAIAGGLRGTGGLALNGNADGLPGGDSLSTLVEGPSILYRDPFGNLVSLRLSGGGTLELARGADGAVTSLSVIGGRVGRSILSGSVRSPARGAVGRTSLPALYGLAGVRVTLTSPPFDGPAGLFPAPAPKIKRR